MRRLLFKLSDVGVLHGSRRVFLLIPDRPIEQFLAPADPHGPIRAGAKLQLRHSDRMVAEVMVRSWQGIGQVGGTRILGIAVETDLSEGEITRWTEVWSED